MFRQVQFSPKGQVKVLRPRLERAVLMQRSVKLREKKEGEFSFLLAYGLWLKGLRPTRNGSSPRSLNQRIGP